MLCGGPTHAVHLRLIRCYRLWGSGIGMQFRGLGSVFNTYGLGKVILKLFFGLLRCSETSFVAKHTAYAAVGMVHKGGQICSMGEGSPAEHVHQPAQLSDVAFSS